MSKDTITCNHSGQPIPYQLQSGLNPQLILKIEQEWGAEKSRIMQEMILAHPEVLQDNDIFISKLVAYGLTDFHWRWLDKALALNSEEYEWFFLTADNSVQAACLIYHPKASRLDGANIFYIDYISSAHWNRDRPGHKKRFSSVGKILIRHTISYAQDQLGYRPGFSLHSLPTAEDYYRHLKMIEFEADPEKEGLKYFEAPPEAATNIAEGGH